MHTQHAGLPGLPSMERSAVGHGWQAESLCSRVSYSWHLYRRLIVRAEHVKQLGAAESSPHAESAISCQRALLVSRPARHLPCCPWICT